MPRNTLVRSRRSALLHSLVVFGTMLTLVACGGDDDDDDDDPCLTCPNGEFGDFSAEASGDVDESFSGDAWAAEDTDGSWGLFMGDIEDEQADESAVWFFDASRPGTGTHSFDATTDLGAFYIHGPSGEIYFADEGTLTLTQSSSNGVEGSFEFTATSIEEGTVTVEGTFDAPMFEE